MPEQKEIPATSQNEEFQNQGLAAGLDKWLASGEETYTPPSEDTEEIKVEPKKNPVAKEESGPKPKTSEAEEEDEGPDSGEESSEEEEFPSIGQSEEEDESGEEKRDSFDEDAFDKQTETILKALEEKGHPGDVYKQLRTELKESKQELSSRSPSPDPEAETLRAQIEELSKFKEEAEGLRQRNEELLKVNDEVAVRNSEEYVNSVRKPIEEMDAIVTAMAEQAGIDPSILGAIITETDVVKQDKMIEDVEMKLGRRSAGRLERLADDFKQIQTKERDMLSNASKTIESSRAQREEAQRAQLRERAEQYKSSVKTVFGKYAERVPGFTDSSGNLTDLAKSIESKTATIDPSTLDPSDLSFMAFSANALPELRKAYVALQKEVSLLKGNKPANAIGDGATPKAKAKDDGPDRMGLAEHMATQDLVFNG